MTGISPYALLLHRLKRNTGTRQRLFLLRLEEKCHSLSHVFINKGALVRSEIAAILYEINPDPPTKFVQPARWDLSALR